MQPVILLLHHRYRHAGGEERAVEDLARLIREHLDEGVEILERESAAVGRREAALGLVAGGLRPDEVAAAIRRTKARVVHAHNVNPTFGPRALQAARAAGARTVLHLHNYRLVCAVGTCFTQGSDCTRCHGRNTLPGLKLNCRGGSRAESAAYAAGLALHQKRLVAAADAIVVPSAFALERLRTLGAPLRGNAHVLSSVQRTFATHSTAAAGTFVLAAGRLTPEKGFADVVDACTQAGLALTIAGDGPQRAELEARAGTPASPGGSPPPNWPRCARGPRSRSSRAATSRSSRSPRSRRWPPRCPRSRRAPAAWRWPSREGLYPTGDVGRSRNVSPPCSATPQAGERALASARARSAPEVIAGRAETVYGGGRNFLPRLGCDGHAPPRAFPPARPRPRPRHRRRRRQPQEGHLGARRDRLAVAVPRLPGARRRHLPDDARLGRGRRASSRWTPRDVDDPSYEWPDEIDTAIAEAKSAGLEVALTVTGAPEWANGDKPATTARPRPPTSPTFVGVAAKRYPSVHLWSIWDGRVQGRRVGQVRASCSTAPTRSSRPPPSATSDRRPVDQRVRPRAGSPSSSWPTARRRGWTCTATTPRAPRRRRAAPEVAREPGRQARHRPRAVSEPGRPHVGPNKQAAWVKAALKATKADKSVYTFGYRGLVDDSGTPTAFRGLLDADGTKRPAFNAFKSG